MTVPIVPGRDAAREAAQAELSKPSYRAHEPGLIQRMLDKVMDLLGHLFSRASGNAPGGRWAFVLLAVLIVGVIVVIRVRTGPLRATAKRRDAVFGDAVRTAADHHRLADEAVRSGDFDVAVVERFRALARGLEERGVLLPQAGRTAEEYASQSAAALPSSVGALRAAAGAFNEVRYGGAVADAAMHDLVRDADRQVRDQRLTVA